jgi:hypothetical protein
MGHGFRLLENANHVRVIGYSLPPTDTAVRYLLKAAIARAEHLKTFHVLCLDDDNNTIRTRYDDFVSFNFYQFQNLDVQRCLQTQHQRSSGQRIGDQHTPSVLEQAHSAFFG